MRRIVFLLLLMAGVALSGGLWWWLQARPAPLAGRLVSVGNEGRPAEIRVFRRADLALLWRDRLRAAEARVAEAEKRAAEARVRHREKWLAYDEAARVCAVGEEYNMPDVQELRADRDAKKAAADEAQAEVDRLVAEGEGMVSLEGFLAAMPAPLRQCVTDATGNFVLPPLGPEDGAQALSPQPEARTSAEDWLASLVTEAGTPGRPSTAGAAGLVLLATVSAGADGQAGPRAWLYLLPEASEDGPPGSVEVSDADRLDLEGIRRFAGSSAP